MSSKPTIVLLDEINCKLVNFQPDILAYFHTKFEYNVPSARFSPKFQLGIWDGKISFFTKSGDTYINLLNKIIPDLVEIDYKFSVTDGRNKRNLQLEHIDKNYFDYIIHPDTQEPLSLREYQVDAVNTLIDKKSGILLAATGAGKTTITAALCKIFNDVGIKCIVIVPSVSLVKQTKATLINCKLDVGELSGGTKDPDHLTVISTWQTLNNIKPIMKDFGMVVADECFDGNTLVLMADNSYKKIKDIKPSDKVLNYNRESQKFEIDTVLRLYTNLTKSKNSKMIRLHFDNGNITDVTEDHEFLTINGYVKAKDLTENHDIIYKCF